jgi:outer membrane protein assembly factor BamA
MIVQEPFPGFTEPRFGNELRAQLRQMSVFEARTAMQVTAAYIWGPDSFDTFFRHRVDTGLGFERRFLKNEGLYLSLGIKNSVYRVPDGETTMEGDPAPASSLLTYLYQRIRLEYRDNETRPHKGFMFQTEIQEAGVAALSSWRYLRSTPDFRFYIPLPFQVTMAVRFALGMYFIKEADKKLDDLSQQLGPRDYRLRGGGATSNRGFLPGQLGDGPDGGVRRWEATAELRVPLTGNFGLVGFFDAGDVNKQKSFRWKYPQASSGFGLRYHTIVGPLRLDFAWRIKNLQVFGPDERDPGGDLNEIDFGFAKMAGAIHLTIGESF